MSLPDSQRPGIQGATKLADAAPLVLAGIEETLSAAGMPQNSAPPCLRLGLGQCFGMVEPLQEHQLATPLMCSTLLFD